MTPDLQKARREQMRWIILLTLQNSRPVEIHEAVVLQVLQGIYPDATALEVRRELDYLADRELVCLNKRPDGVWLADLTRHGVDVVEYTVDVEPGIARPAKYWAG